MQGAGLILVSSYFQARDWMDQHTDHIHNCFSSEFMEGIEFSSHLLRINYRGENHIMPLCTMPKPKVT